MELSDIEKRALEKQRTISNLQGFWIAPFLWILFRLMAGYRLQNLRRFRREIRKCLREVGDGPLLICANHLTMIDSFLIAGALHHPLRYMKQFSLCPWNLPELRNFGQKWWLRLMCYLCRCIYVERQGSLSSKKETLAKAHYILKRGDPVLVFPEGGRTRTGRVDRTRASIGVGLLLQALPKTKVLCVYVRGRSQVQFSDFPKRGEKFDVLAELIDPNTARERSEGAEELVDQVMQTLVTLEERCVGAVVKPLERSSRQSETQHHRQS